MHKGGLTMITPQFPRISRLFVFLSILVLIVGCGGGGGGDGGSSEEAQVKAPDVLNKAQASAETDIKALGLTVGAVTKECSGDIALGNVINSTPAAGTTVDPGTAVNLVVSTGPCGDLTGNEAGFDVLGAGYDVFDNYADPLKVKAEIIDHHAMLTAGLIEMRSLERSTFYIAEGSSLQQYTNALNHNTNISGS